MTLSIPLWLLVIIIVLVVGSYFYLKVAKNGGGAYDFVTPLAMLAIGGVTLAVVLGILLGKFLF